MWFYVGLASVFFIMKNSNKFSSCSLLCEKHYALFSCISQFIQALGKVKKLLNVLRESGFSFFSSDNNFQNSTKRIWKWSNYEMRLLRQRAICLNITTTFYSVITYPLVSVLQGLKFQKSTLLFLIHIFDKCTIKILIMDIVTHRGSGVYFNSCRNITRNNLKISLYNGNKNHPLFLLLWVQTRLPLLVNTLLYNVI